MTKSGEPARRTRITTEVGFDRPGIQAGYLSVPYSTHRSAYGRIQVPIVCVRGGCGPTALLMAGNHGDEYEGQIALSRLACALNADQVNGRILILPAANLPAAMAGTRTSPLDGGNLNRLFPGDLGDGPTAMIAHYIEAELLPLADLALDLHSGGTSLEYLPCVLVRDNGSPAHVARTFAMLRAFGPDIAYLSDGATQGAERTFHSAADRAGVPVITTELGGGGQVSREALRLAENGIRGVLIHAGILDGPPPAARPLRLLRSGGSTSYVLAPEPGIFEPLVALGEQVEAGQPAGHVHAVDVPCRPAVPVPFRVPGMVICRRALGRVERGDCLFQVVADVPIPT